MVPLKLRLVWVVLFAGVLAFGVIDTVTALSINTNSVLFNGVTLNGNAQTTYGTPDAWQVDASDVTEGWNVVVSASDFINENSRHLSADNLSVRLLDGNIVVISGESGPTSTQTTYAAIGSQTIKIISANAGFGQGVYNLTPDFQLNIPPQTFAGTYSANLTISVVAGP